MTTPAKQKITLLCLGLTAMLVLLSSGWLAAQQESGETTITSRFRQANQAYSEGNYTQALEQYNDLIDISGPSAGLYYNAGCAALKAGELGEAVVFFHRAARLDPRDQDIRANLEFVGELIGAGGETEQEDNIFFSFLSGLVFSLTTSEVSILQLVFLLVFTLGAVAVVSARAGGMRRTGLAMAVAGFLLLAVNSAVLGAHIYRYHTVNEAVVVRNEAEALSGPGQENTRVLVIPEGTVVRVRENRGEWALVSLPSGRSGWLKVESIELI